MVFTTLARRHNKVLLKIGGEKFRPFIQLYQGWKDIVGDLLASRSHPFRFKDSILYIAVQNNAWLQELGPDSAIKAHSVRHRIHVGPKTLTQVGHLVNE